MRERPRNEPKPVFEKGMLVKLKDDLPGEVQNNWNEVFEKGSVFRVLCVSNVPEYGEVASLGPSDMTQKNIEEYQPGMEDHDLRYEDVIHITTENLRTAHN